MTEGEAFQTECWYIDYYKYKCGFNLVNLTDGGDNPPHGSGRYNNNYGNLWTKEQKIRASRRVIESQRYAGDRNPRATKIMCIETMEIFNCIKDANLKYSGSKQGSIYIALTNKTRVAYGLHWAKLENVPHIKTKEDAFFHLLQCYKEKPGSKAIVCMEDRKLFKSVEDFREYSNISLRKISTAFKNKQQITFNNKNYLFVKYINSLFA